MVVHGNTAQGGLDEITIAGVTRISELRHGEVIEYTIAPEDFGMKTTAIETIQARDSAQSREMLMAVLDNQPGPALDIVALNAGAAIYVAGVGGVLGGRRGKSAGSDRKWGGKG